MNEVSVIVPAYNAGKYLAQTLHSVYRQTLKPFQVVVVNDCSTDNTEMIAQACGKLYFHDIEFTYLKHEENMGIGATRQDGALAAKGDFIAFLSSDDVYHPEFLISCVEKLDQKHATFTDYYRCNSKLQPMEVFKAPFFTTFEEFRILATNWALKKNMFVNFSSVIIPRRFFHIVEFQKSLRHGEDLIFLLDTIIAGLKWKCIRKPLLNYRLHSLQGTALRDLAEWKLLWKLTSQRLTELGVPKEEIEAAIDIDSVLFRASQRGFRKTMRKCFRKIKSII